MIFAFREITTACCDNIFVIICAIPLSGQLCCSRCGFSRMHRVITFVHFTVYMQCFLPSVFLFLYVLFLCLHKLRTVVFSLCSIVPMSVPCQQWHFIFASHEYKMDFDEIWRS